MFKMLIDTCVWLDLAKDPKQTPVLDVIEELLRREMLSLIVPPRSARRIQAQSGTHSERKCPKPLCTLPTREGSNL